MLSRVYSAQTIGLHSNIISIEADVFRGFHTFSVIGLPDKAVEESRDRVSSAIKSVGFTSPKEHGQKKVTVALAPADIKKEGPVFDIPIALAYLAAAEEIRFEPEGRLFAGELSLSGALRPIKGALFLARAAQQAGFQELFVPQGNAEEASLIRGIQVYPAENLRDIIAHINTKRASEHQKQRFGIEQKSLGVHTPSETPRNIEQANTSALEEIRGHTHAKRALAIAAAGGHNVALSGPPGTGKTMLARALAALMPPLSYEHALETTGIHSVAGTGRELMSTEPPYRAPHHTASHTAVIGGGTIPKPGEATLAHRGVLFLDEFPEFDRRVIEALRQPLEEGIVQISRVSGTDTFPASFVLVAAMNPCPCGYAGDRERECTCTQSQLIRYNKKISGPIVDRIDLWVHVPRIAYEELGSPRAPEKEGAATRLHERIKNARAVQDARKQATTNAELSSASLDNVAPLSSHARSHLDSAAHSLQLSPRAYHRTIKVARTIADLAHEPDITKDHILEALQYRRSTDEPNSL